MQRSRIKLIRECAFVCKHAGYSTSLITHSSIRPLVRISTSVHLRGWVDGRVAGGTLGDAGTIVDDVLVAVGDPAVLLLPLASVMELLAVGEGDAAPALEGVVVFRAALHTGSLVLEATAGHAVTGWVGLLATTQALVMTALVILGTGPVFTLNRTHCGWHTKVRLTRVFLRQVKNS